MRTYAGTWTAIITPFQENGSLDEAAFRKLIQRQIENGVTGIVPVGTTGERTGVATKGEIRFNTTLQSYEGYDGNNWGTLGGMTDVDGDTKIEAESSAGTDNDELQFFTAGSERLRIFADGHISASGDITGSNNLQVMGRISSSTMVVNATTTASTAITTNNITNGYQQT